MHSDDLERFSRISLKKKNILAGLGNPFRKDDAAGLHVIDRLASEMLGPAFTLLKCYQNPENYFDRFYKDTGCVVFFDALHTIDRDIIILAESQVGDFSFSTHTFGMRTIIGYLSNMINELSVYIVGIRAKDMSLGEGLSEETSAIVERVAGVFGEICKSHMR